MTNFILYGAIPEYLISLEKSKKIVPEKPLKNKARKRRK